jgi:hypothetical protein
MGRTVLIQSGCTIYVGPELGMKLHMGGLGGLQEKLR